MDWQISEFSIVMIISTFTAILVALIVWERRIFRGGVPLTLMMLAVAEWSLAQAVEVSIIDIPTKILLSKFSYIGIMSVPVLLFTFTMQYIRMEARLVRLYKVLLWIIPLITLVLVMTNEWHMLVWSGFTNRIIAGKISLIYGHGIWFWVAATFIYMVSSISAFLLLTVAYRMKKVSLFHTIALVIAALLPSTANILYLIGFGWFNVLDLTPVAFTITGVILTWAFFGSRFFRYVPVLRNMIIETMPTGMIVLEPGGRIIDINSAARKIINNKTENLAGRTIESVLSDDVLLTSIQKLEAGYCQTISIENQNATRYLEICHTEILPEIDINGYLLFINDITANVISESELRSKKATLDLMIDSIPAMLAYIDNEKHYVLVNKTYADWYDLPKEEIIGRHIKEVLAEDKAYRKAEKYYDSVLNGISVSFENVLSHHGDQCVVDVHYVPHFGDGNEVLGFFALIHDITNRKQVGDAEVKADKLADAIQKAGIAISSSLDFNQVLSLILEQIDRVVSISHASVLLLQEEQLVVVAVKNSYQINDIVGNRYLLRESPAEAKVITEKALVNSSDIQKEYPDFPEKFSCDMRSWLGVPLVIKDNVIGMLSLGSDKPAYFTTENEKVIAIFASQVAIALENARVFEKMKQMSIEDMLTGVYNRRHLFTLGENEFERSIRYDKPLSIIMFDLDHFKRINDTHGQKIGDLVLQTIAKRCYLIQRKVDIIGRYGGEEFIVILPETDLRNARFAAERLCSIIKETEIPSPSGKIHVTASFGVAERDKQTISFEMLLDYADRALYRAKQAGSNCVKVFDNQMTESV